MQKDIRWKQRFQNFEKAFQLLKKSLVLQNLNELEEMGVIHNYELTFELGWKTLKDYLNEKQIDVKFPRDIIKESFKYELVEDGELWMDMLDKRNLLTHTYDEEKADIALDLIKEKYILALNQVYEKLKRDL